MLPGLNGTPVWGSEKPIPMSLPPKPQQMETAEQCHKN